jgi:LytS/YehU family sensor histidine kinase
MQSKDAPKMILKLSDILRYNLYDGTQEMVPLEKEIRYIENYVSLHKLKDENIKNIHVNFSEVDGSVMIAPLILIPFVENSFKHSKIEDVNQGWIRIELKTLEDKISFRISNSIPESEFNKDLSGGIGLENVKRRLELIYPKRYELQISQESDKYSVELTIMT